MQLPYLRCEGCSDEPTALQQRTKEQDPVGAESANQDSDEGSDKHGDGEIETADKGVVP
jgi:hypothetical protein